MDTGSGAALIFIVLVLPIAQVSCQACGSKAVGEATPSSFQDTLDTNSGYGYLAKDSKYTFDCCGLISGWHTVIGALGTIRFQIWRPSSGTSYELVGENSYTFSTADQLIEQTLTVDTGAQITVLPNDIIGWYTAATDMVPYKGGSGQANDNVQLSMSAPSVGAVVDWSGATTLNLRTYALNAKTTDNNAPYFTNLPASSLQYDDTDNVIFIYTLSFTDDDPQDTTLTAAMTTTPNEFNFDARNRIRTIAANWAVGSYTLDFTVTDQCGNEGTGSVTIEVLNTAPVMTNMATSASVSEDTTTATSLTDLTVTDEQTYTCTYAGSDPFNIQQATGSTTYTLYLNGGANLNYDTQNQYTLTITCTDDLGLSTSKDIVVSITENTAPSMTNLPGTVTVDASATGNGAEIFAITTVDPDSTTLFYNMTCDPVNCPFQVLNSGSIYTTENLDLHKTTAYDLQVWVYDTWSLVGPETLAVTLSNINYIPEISNIPSGLTETVPENSNIGTVVLDVDVTDDNAADTHTFTATFSSAEGANYFEIVPSTGVIQTKAAIDYEDLLGRGITSFSVAVTADDGRESSTTKYFTIVVSDVNEPQTSFSQTTFQINGVETTTSFTDPNPSIPASLIDPDDTRDTQTYTMDCGANTGLFSMNPTTAKITKSAEYDLDVPFQTSETIACVLTATDEAGHTITADINIVIEEENDNPPVLNKDTYTYFLPINTGAGTQFLSYSSTDDDVLADHTDTTYSLSGSSLFGTTDCCRIYNNVNFSTTTYNVGDSFPMTLTATNNNGLQDTAAVNVILIDPVTTVAPSATTAATTVESAPALGSGSSSYFLDDPENLGWFIPCMLLLAGMLALLAYMIYRCIRNPGIFSKLGKLCKGRSLRCNCPKRSKRSAKLKTPKTKNKGNNINKVRQLESTDGNYEWNTWSHADFSSKIEHR